MDVLYSIEPRWLPVTVHIGTFIVVVVVVYAVAADPESRAEHAAAAEPLAHIYRLILAFSPTAGDIAYNP